MRAEPGYQKDSDVLHLTRSLLAMTALCGHYPVEMIGVPDNAVVCGECEAAAERRGASIDESIWARVQRKA